MTGTKIPDRGQHPGRRGERRASPNDGLDVALRALARWRGTSGGVTVVAIDGHGASGKTTIAESLRAKTGASVVHTDDFFLPPAPGRGRPAASQERAGQTGRGIGSYYDVERMRTEALEPLRAGREAVFCPYDWDTGAVSRTRMRVAPSDLVLFEGVYSGAPELGDLVEWAICVDTPEPERLARLRDRIAPEDWDEEWLRAEKEYFAGPRPLHSFDLLIGGTGEPSPAP